MPTHSDVSAPLVLPDGVSISDLCKATPMGGHSWVMQLATPDCEPVIPISVCIRELLRGELPAPQGPLLVARPPMCDTIERMIGDIPVHVTMAMYACRETGYHRFVELMTSHARDKDRIK